MDNTTNGTSIEQFPLPANADQVFTVGAVEYRFDPHSHLPYPVKQFNEAGQWLGSVRGIAMYDKMTQLGIIAARPGYVAPEVAGKATPKARSPKTIKVQLPDGTIIEGVAVKEPKAESTDGGVVVNKRAKRTTTPDGTPLGVDLTTGEPIAPGSDLITGEPVEATA